MTFSKFASERTFPRKAWLCFNDWAGFHKTAIVLIGETPQKFRITSTVPIKLAGRNRFLSPYRSTLVPKGAVLEIDE